MASSVSTGSGIGSAGTTSPTGSPTTISSSIASAASPVFFLSPLAALAAANSVTSVPSAGAATSKSMRSSLSTNGMGARWVISPDEILVRSSTAKSWPNVALMPTPPTSAPVPTMSSE